MQNSGGFRALDQWVKQVPFLVQLPGLESSDLTNIDSECTLSI